MIKEKVLFIVCMTIGGFAIAQNSDNDLDNRDKFQFGVRAGLNYSNVYDAEGEQFRADGKLGLAGGVFAALPFGTYTGLQPEVLFSQKGFKSTGVILGMPYENKRITTYIDVPLYFSFKPSEFLTILAGPQFSYLTSSRNVFTSGSTTLLQEQEFENDDIRKNLMSFSVGATININDFLLGARASWDLQDNKSNGTSSTPRYKNQWIQFTLGYVLYTKK